MGSVTSAAALLALNVPPTIANQPQRQTVVAGQSVTFSVGASGTAPLSHQWRFNADNISRQATRTALTGARFRSGCCLWFRRSQRDWQPAHKKQSS